MSPIFICHECKCVENTALGQYWGEQEENKLCSECARGVWHGRFPKERFDPNKWERDSKDFIKLKEPKK
jgi:hypothetical protein